MRRTHVVMIAALLSVVAATAGAQARYKGVFTPVSYGEDVELNDVFFVTVDEGWVSGGNGVSAGVLLHTTDGGATWNVALGDPGGSQRPFYHLRFVDQTTGFVAQGTQGGDHMLLRTTNGETWKVTGTVPQHHSDYRFVSATVGVASAGHGIMRTTDAGRTWKQAFECALRVQVQGLTKTTDCEISSFAFPSPTVGYALGGSFSTKGLYVFKTTDAGASWTGSLVVPGDDDGREGHIVFTDDRNGYACLANGKLFGTDDGGDTWSGLPGASCENKAPILFADPEVGWAMRYTKLTFTADGGKRWVSRDVALPAAVNAFSLPRRDRAYVVGDHGMVFRYSIVPVEQAVANSVAAPVMPAFSTALADRGSDFAQFVTGIETNLAGGSTDAGTGVQPSGGMSGGDAPSAFIAGCCGKRLSSLELVMRAINAVAPSYAAKYKNLNLVTLGMRTADALPQRTDNLKAALKAFRTATDKAAADQALATIKSALSEFRAVADTAVQRKP